MTINVLGTKYEISRVAYTDDLDMIKDNCCGICNTFEKRIDILDLKTSPMWQNEPPEAIEAAEQEILRHEIIHAFLRESGLTESAHATENAWVQNEEMVDWFAVQWPKIAIAFTVAGCA